MPVISADGSPRVFAVRVAMIAAATTKRAATSSARANPVIDSRAGDIRAMLAAIEASHGRPAGRVKALLRAIGGDGEVVARFGCPLGTLCQELSKHPSAPDPSSLLRLPIDWAERQFAAMGLADARDLAVQVIAAYQGTALLTSALRDPGIMARESARIEAWLDSLEGGPG